MSLGARASRHATAVAVGVLALLAYLPALASSPGRMPADTKLYLYLDPAGLVGRAASTFEPDQFAGWVPFQQITYLWPSGPWYLLFDVLGVPDWVAHRLWIATIMFLAGAGMLWTARLLGLSRSGAFIAALVYQLAPFMLAYISRTSLLLLPWAGLGWIVGLTVRATLGQTTRRNRPALAAGSLARPGPDRVGGRNSRFGQRNDAGDDRARPVAVDRPRCVAASDPLAGGTRRDRSNRGAVPCGFGVVDLDAVRAIAQRRVGARIHRDAGRRQSERNRLRGAPGARILALLPTRPRRRDDHGVVRPSRRTQNDRPRLPGRSRRVRRVGPDVVATSTVRRAVCRGRRSAGGRSAPDRRPLTRDGAPPRRWRGRAGTGAAEQYASGAPAAPGRRARCRRARVGRRCERADPGAPAPGSPGLPRPVSWLR